jgi:hypothetical protein
MVLGQILTNYKNIEVNEFIRVTNDKTTLDNKLPLLIIGKNNAREIIGESNMKYLDRKVNDKIYWTFGKTERRDEFERDLKNFNDLVINNLIKSVKYEFINSFTLTYSKVKKIINLVNLKEYKTYLILDNTLYLYHSNTVYGISLNELKYIGLNQERVLKLLNRNSYNNFLKNQYCISKEIRNVLKNKVFLVPYIYFLEKCEKML